MAICPFAQWRPLSGASGAHVGGPYKIVHHTTEGRSAEGAMTTFRERRSDPHFTVDANGIYQHIDTNFGARALRNAKGGVETNRDSAVQIELVGFAHLPKDPNALVNMARLCRWIESEHHVPAEWPAGLPRPAKNGKDPGGHTRDAAIWNQQSGHYGHCHVPENSHWDPGYSEQEVAFLMGARFRNDGALDTTSSPALPRSVRSRAIGRDLEESTMPDHGVVPLGINAYLRDLPIDPIPMEGARARDMRRATRLAEPPADGAMVNVGSVMSFVGSVDAQERDDILYSVQLAQRGANAAFDRFSQMQDWYRKYTEVLENLGWTSEQFAFTHYKQGKGNFQMDKAALSVIAAIATGGQLAVLKAAIDALGSMGPKDDPVVVFDQFSASDGSGNFQLGAVVKAANGTLSMALGAFHFRSVSQQKQVLFFKWGKSDVNFWTAAQRMTFNREMYARYRDGVIAKLGANAEDFLAALEIDSAAKPRRITSKRASRPR